MIALNIQSRASDIRARPQFNLACRFWLNVED